MRGSNDLLLYQSDKTGEWRWRLTSGSNGKIIGASSESFKQLRWCINNFRLSDDRPVAYSVRYRKGGRVSRIQIHELLGEGSKRSARLDARK